VVLVYVYVVHSYSVSMVAAYAHLITQTMCMHRLVGRCALRTLCMYALRLTVSHTLEQMVVRKALSMQYQQHGPSTI
jgi:hypothetical protein